MKPLRIGTKMHLGICHPWSGNGSFQHCRTAY